MYILQNLKISFLMSRAVGRFFLDEFNRGTLLVNLKSFMQTKEFSEDISWGELFEEKAEKYGDRDFLFFEGKKFSFRQMDENANRLGNFFLSLGGGRGKGVAIMMGNCPQFVDVFAGSQKAGMYSIPTNTSLRGDSLLYILNHSDAEFIVIDEEFLDFYYKIADRLEHIKHVIVNRQGDYTYSLPYKLIPLSSAYLQPADKPDVKYGKDDICFILYTSGTTGLPKGVAYHYRKTMVKLLSIPAYALYKKSDILYTPLPLFHGNALWMTFTQGMHRGAKVVLSRKFSATNFWNEVRKYNVTSFNTIGAMIQILMKQPTSAEDRNNKVRFTLSAACTADDWPKFEKRFGIKIYEGYGSVDGGGKSIMNLGNAPIGSIGKPSPGVVYRLVDNEGKDVPDGTPGELIFEFKGDKRPVEYFKNEKATNEKLRNGWIYTGDLVRRDKKGYLYFVGRNAEFMRIKGENVSAYEVEHAIQKHPCVLEAAVYAVPSEMSEDEIMASISIVDGRKLGEAELVEFLKENLPKFAIPRFIKVVNDFPKTETQRIIKKELEKAGVVPGTFDMQKIEC